jgi:hypothetical protein
MSWGEPRHLTDVVEFPCPSGEPHTHAVAGEFLVYAAEERHRHVTARLHLCWMLFSAGMMKIERSESTEPDAE